jgi:SnoaL-like domain
LNSLHHGGEGGDPPPFSSPIILRAGASETVLKFSFEKRRLILLSALQQAALQWEKGEIKKMDGTMNAIDGMNAAIRFNEKINQQDVEGLAELMTEDHAFIDNEGTVTKGRQAMKEGWGGFFRQFPDYRNVFNTVTVQNEVVVMVGRSICSHPLLNGPNI